MAQNIPFVIASDDPMFWDVTPLSHDFYITFLGIASRQGDLRVLKKLAMNSIQYSSMNETEQKRAFQMWQSEWDNFIENVIQDNQSN